MTRLDLCSERVSRPPSGCTTTLAGFTPIRAFKALFDFDGVFIGEIPLKDPDKIFAGNAVLLADDSLNVAREHVYCGNDEHVVFSAQNMDPAVCSAAGAFCVVDSTDIACAETDERTRVLSERCEYQLNRCGCQWFQPEYGSRRCEVRP